MNSHRLLNECPIRQNRFSPTVANVFCLPAAQAGRSLASMAAMSQNEDSIRLGKAQPTLTSLEPASRFSLPARYSNDTLHCTKRVAGEAVQFNSSVSAMPSHHSLRSFVPVALGTADTLLLR